MRTARCRARSITSGCPTPAAASWARRSAWTSCARNVWRRRRRADRRLRRAQRRAGLRPRARAPRAAADRQARDPGLERRHDARRAGRGSRRPPGRTARAARFGGVRRGVDCGQGVHGRAAAGRGAALDPHRDAARPSTTTRPSTSATTRAIYCPSGLSQPAEAHLASLALAAFEACGGEGWGRADFMMDRSRPAAAARDQHRSRHDRATAWCRWRRARSASTSRSWCGACSRRASRDRSRRRAAPRRGGAEAMRNARGTAASRDAQRSWLPRLTGAPARHVARGRGRRARRGRDRVLWAARSADRASHRHRSLQRVSPARRSSAWCAHDLHGAGLVRVTWTASVARSRHAAVGGSRRACSAAGRAGWRSRSSSRSAVARWDERRARSMRAASCSRRRRFVPPELPAAFGSRRQASTRWRALPRDAGPLDRRSACD